METLPASALLAALGHEARLAAFRLLVEAGPQGLSAGVIGERLGLAPATLSFHLAHLARAGLVRAVRRSRFIHYSARFDTMDRLIAFLTHDCCQGKPCLANTPRGAKRATRTAAAGKRSPRRGASR
jgi:DNA-binding transcriptional ArsR family regulator